MLDPNKLLKLPFGKTSDYILFLFGVIIAPYWFLFHFQKNFLVDYTIIDRLIFSIASGFPVAIISVILLIFFIGDLIDFADDYDVHLNKLISILGFAGIFTAIIFYLPVIVKFFWHPLEKQGAIWISFCGCILILLIAFLFRKTIRKKME